MDVNKEIKEIKTVLQKDLDSAKKSRIAVTALGIILLLVVFFVFMSLASTVKENVRPDTIAEVATYATRQVIKDGRPVVEREFKKNIPVFLKNLRRSLIKDLIPSMRIEIQKRLAGVIKDAYVTSSRSFTDAVRSAAAMVKPVTEGQAEPTPELLAKLIVQEFEKEKAKRYADKPRETLGAQFEQSRAMLEGLNEKLLLLTSRKKPKTREEAMELKFLRAWVSLLSEGGDLHDKPLNLNKGTSK